jgi:hypothetical protein
VSQNLPTTAPDGTDLTLIRWMLTLTPAERLDLLQSTIDAAEELRALRDKWTSEHS